MKTIKTPCQDALKEILSYDECTGQLCWKTRPERNRWDVGFNKQFAGKLAGTTTATGMCISIKGKSYNAHRIIWKWMTGQEPPDIIDHINGNPLDNRWVNLREATPMQNSANAKLSCRNTSGYKNVIKNGNRWRALIVVNGKAINGGSFGNAVDASQAAEALRIKHYGEYRRQ